MQQRGLSEAQAMSLSVNGFVNDLVRQFPMEYRVELKRLIELEMEGSVGYLRSPAHFLSRKMSYGTAVLEDVTQSPEVNSDIIPAPQKAARDLPAWFRQQREQGWREFSALPTPDAQRSGLAILQRRCARPYTLPIRSRAVRG